MEPSAARCTVRGVTEYVDGKVIRNPHGTPETLVPGAVHTHSHGTPNFKHGAKARVRRYDERAREIEVELLGLPHVSPVDAPGLREIAKLMALIERVDQCLAAGNVERMGNRSGLIDTRRSLSRELRSWLKEIGGTPLARATWAANAGRGWDAVRG